MGSSNRRHHRRPWYRRVRRLFRRKPSLLLLIPAAVVAVGLVYAAFTYSPTPTPVAAPQTTAATTTPTVSAAPVPDPMLSVNRPDGTWRVLFVGDSLTGNLFASTEDAGFRPTMMRSFDAIGPTVETQGFRVNATAEEVATVVDIGVGQDLAVIELGTNDVDRTTPEQFSTEYGALLDTIRAASPTVAFLCAGSWQLAENSAAYDAVIKSQCEAHGGVYRPLSDLHADQSNRGPAGVEKFGGVSDDFHPNDTGYAAIAGRLFRAISLQ